MVCELACVRADYKTGFGGKFGVQTDRQDKSAAGWDHIEKVEKHDSQKDYTKVGAISSSVDVCVSIECDLLHCMGSHYLAVID